LLYGQAVPTLGGAAFARALEVRMASGSEDNHEFGSVSTDLKLALIERYLIEFSKALRPTFKTLWYIDAFAGTGVRTIKYKAEPAHLFASAVEERLERRRGSAQIALDNRLILHTCAEPNIAQHRKVGTRQYVCHALRPLGQNLVGMTRRRRHHFPDTSNEIGWYVFVEKIGHRIDEDLSRSLPSRRDF
jgi:hypothetical protein